VPVGIVGHIWHHLRARIDNIRLRVLHPNIQEHQTVNILRGLPEGSRLSPKRRESSKRSYYIISPRVIIKAIIIITEGSLKVESSAPPYSAYLLLTLSMNSKPNFSTLLLILHLVSNTMEQRKFGLVGYCT